jgi:hypothetical protein
MKIGVSIFNTDYSIRIDELARALEARGFESLWLSEHTHIPKSRRAQLPQAALITPSKPPRRSLLSIQTFPTRRNTDDQMKGLTGTAHCVKVCVAKGGTSNAYESGHR